MFSASLVLCCLPVIAAVPGEPPAPAPIRIGVLEDASSGGDLAEGAAEAVAEINRGGGIGGRPVELLRVAAARPWRDAASLTARLAFEAQVFALVGPAEGTGAHVATQIATRRRIPLLTLAPDDSLTRAYVPWVFRGVPGDAQQASALLSQLFPEPAGHSVALAVPVGSEGRRRVASLEDACAELGMTIHSIVEVDRRTLTPESAKRMRSLQSVDVLMLWLDPDDAIFLLGEIGVDARPVKMAGSTRLDDPRFWAQLPAAGEGMVLPLLRVRPQAGTGSVRRALGHDMVQALAAAAAGAPGRISPALLQHELSSGVPVSGRTGRFRFDSRGNRVGAVPLATVQEGRPVLLPTAGEAGPQTKLLSNSSLKAAGGTS